MKFTEIYRVLLSVTYKAGWFLRVTQDATRGFAPYLQWCFGGACVVTGNIEIQYCRKWYLSAHMTESELVQTAFAAALAAEEHECRENFQYQGKRVFGPHISVQALLGVCDTQDVRAPQETL